MILSLYLLLMASYFLITHPCWLEFVSSVTLGIFLLVDESMLWCFLAVWNNVHCLFALSLISALYFILPIPSLRIICGSSLQLFIEKCIAEVNMIFHPSNHWVSIWWYIYSFRCLLLAEYSTFSQNWNSVCSSLMIRSPPLISAQCDTTLPYTSRDVTSFHALMSLIVYVICWLGFINQTFILNV